jgi:hypothetical protein
MIRVICFDSDRQNAYRRHPYCQRFPLDTVRASMLWKIPATADVTGLRMINANFECRILRVRAPDTDRAVSGAIGLPIGLPRRPG